MKRFAFVSIAVLGLLAVGLVWTGTALSAQSRPCGCYCGIWLPAPCSDNACKAQCGWQNPAPGPSPGGVPGPSIDYEAERRAREEAERQREENDRREQERRKAEQQKQFERDRDNAAKSLKGSTSTGAFGLKGVAPADAGLRAPGERVDRDLVGRQAAWKQLHCAASILAPALAALQPQPGKDPDFTEYRYLSSEALNALNGQRLGVQCAAAPPVPEISGRAPDLAKAIEAQKKLVERANAAATKLEQAAQARKTDPNDPIARAYQQQQANEAAHERQISPIRERQREINRERERKPGQEAENQAKKELEQVAKVVKKIEEGDATALSDMISKEEAPKRGRGGANP